MADIPENLKYTKDHEWVRFEGNFVVLGITDHAQSSLGDIVFVELPEKGKELSPGDTFGAVESVKAVSDLYSPISGKVVEVNGDLNDNPSKINSSPYDQAWMIKIDLGSTEAATAAAKDLLDSGAYLKIVESES